MKWFKRYTAAALLMVLVLTAAACGRSDKNTTEGKSTQENTVNDGTDETDGTMDGTVEEPTDKNAVEDVTDGAGDALEDMGDGVMDGVDDVVDGAENAVDDITGQTKN